MCPDETFVLQFTSLICAPISVAAELLKLL